MSTPVNDDSAAHVDQALSNQMGIPVIVDPKHDGPPIFGNFNTLPKSVKVTDDVWDAAWAAYEAAFDAMTPEDQLLAALEAALTAAAPHLADARVAVLEAELARIKSRLTDLVDAGWMSQEAATELRNVYDGDEEGQR